MENTKNYSANNYEAILKETSQTKTKVNSFSKTYPAFIALIIFIALSFYVRQSIRENYESETKASFNKAVSSVMLRLENKYNSNLQVLTSIQGLYDEYVEVVRDYFKLYSSVPTNTNASIKSLMYIPRIPSNEVGNHVFNMQRQGLWDYAIHPLSANSILYPVEFIEPVEKNIKHAGFDFNTTSAEKAAIDKAKDNNVVTATKVGKTLNMEDGAFYIIAPVYKEKSARSNKAERDANYSGVVVEEIDANRFFSDALGGNFPSDTSIVFELVDKADGEVQVYKSKNFDNFKAEDLTLFNVTETLKIADRDIDVKFSTIPNYVDWVTRNLHNILFVASLVLSILLFLFIYSVTTSRARAIDLAVRMTRSQRRIVEASKDIIAVLDLSGNWKSLNAAADAIYNTRSEDMIGKNIAQLFVNPEDANSFTKKVSEVTGEVTERIDYEMVSANNDNKWISWSFTISKIDGLIYAIGRDVTLEKLAEKESILRAKQMQLAEQFTSEASEFKSNFMTKLSHQMRNSLTGIMGYLQLLEMRLFEDDEEQMSYILLAKESSEELMTFVSDLVDVADGSGANKVDIKTIDTKISLNKALTAFNAENIEKLLSISFMDEGETSAKVIVDEILLNKAMRNIYLGVSQGLDKMSMQVAATENPYEGATEIQLMTDPNPLVAEMIALYKEHSNNILGNLHKDKNDVLLSLSIAASIVKMMNGTMTVETFGADDGNVVQITLPTYKKIS